jgi:pimeloyl-ACP methyl ester carboxylesterase
MRHKGLLSLLVSLPLSVFATPPQPVQIQLPKQKGVAAPKVAAHPHQAKGSQTNWYDGFLFQNQSMTYEFIRALGYTYAQGADIGECISTAKKIQMDETPETWYQAWLETANRIYLLGQKFGAEGDVVSARMAYLRASNYYRSASFYMDAPENRKKAISAWKMSQQSFLLAIESMPNIKSVNIPYDRTTLHGYFIAAETKDAPLLIINTGFDGTAEELYFAAGQAAYKHGYNVLFFDGPGQGQTLKMQNIPFRPDWEKVVHAAINFASRLPNVDDKKIALMGMSMGGYLALRACAFESKIKACILDPGIYNFVATALSRLPEEDTKLLDKDPEKFDQIINQSVKENIEANWFYNNGMWAFGAKTPAEFLRMAAQFKTGSWVKRVRAPALVIKNAADQFGADQAHKLFQALPGRKTFYVFSQASTGQAHCQVGASAISDEVIFNWLNKVLNYRPLAAAPPINPNPATPAPTENNQ